jgi:Tryptophan synthase alpha chain
VVDALRRRSGRIPPLWVLSSLDLIALLAPTTPASRIRRIAASASGFLYLVSVLGVTGGRATLPPELPGLVAGVREVADLPVGVGFGVQSPEQAAWVAGLADAVIVGSALARVIEDFRTRKAFETGKPRGSLGSFCAWTGKWIDYFSKRRRGLATTIARATRMRGEPSRGCSRLQGRPTTEEPWVFPLARLRRLLESCSNVWLRDERAGGCGAPI